MSDVEDGIDENVVEIPLQGDNAKGAVMLVDRDMQGVFERHGPWHLDKGGYAIAHFKKPDGDRTTIKSHRLAMRCHESNVAVSQVHHLNNVKVCMHRVCDRIDKMGRFSHCFDVFACTVVCSSTTGGSIYSLLKPDQKPVLVCKPSSKHGLSTTGVFPSAQLFQGSLGTRMPRNGRLGTGMKIAFVARLAIMCTSVMQVQLMLLGCRPRHPGSRRLFERNGKMSTHLPASMSTWLVLRSRLDII